MSVALAEVLSQKNFIFSLYVAGRQRWRASGEVRETGTDYALYPISDVASTFVVNGI